MQKPWYRKFNDTWYVTLDGKQVSLAKGKANKDQALQAYHQLMLAGPPTGSTDVATAALLEAFLDWSHRHNEPSTYGFYHMFLQSFCDRHGAVRVQELKPFHVTHWLDAEAGWNDATRRCAITALKRPLNWAADEGLIPANPLKKVKKPPARCREKVLTAEERKALFAAVKDKAFKLFLFALGQTGCRPGEVARVAAQHVDLDAGTWTFRQHKTAKKTGRPRAVYLSPPMVRLCRKLIEQHPTGPLFPNARGRPWSRNAIRCRFRRLRAKLHLDKGVVAYAYRHTFATDGLAADVPVATMAELLGHSDTAMISRHYSHLRQKAAHLQEAVLRATGQRGGV